MVRTLAADPVLDVRADVGEGPAWDAAAQRLIWVDITASEVHAYDPGTGADRARPAGSHVGAAVPADDGRLLLAVRDGLAFMDGDGSIAAAAEIEAGLPGNRMNDAKCDPAGRLWAGTMPYESAPGRAALYRYDGRTVQTVLAGVGLSNGLAWSPDGTIMYYIDSRTQRIDAFDYVAEAGRIGGRRAVVEIDPAEGMPDGMTVDDTGGLWLALFGGGQVRRYAPDGRLDAVLPVPATQVTSCAFGGPRGDTLYITSAAHRLTAGELARQPRAGNLFAADVGVTGPPATPFRVPRGGPSPGLRGPACRP